MEDLKYKVSDYLYISRTKMATITTLTRLSRRVSTHSPIPLFYTLFYALVPHPFSIAVVPFIKSFF
jgi:hypothetical protein